MLARRPALVPILSLAFALAQPLRAETVSEPSSLATSIAEAQRAAAVEDCAGVLAALDPVAAGMAKGDDRVLVQRLRLICLGREGRVEEFAAVQRELAEALPHDGVVRAFGVIVALEESRFADAADQLATLAATSPASLDLLTGAAVRQISAHLRQGEGRDARARMIIALARIDWEPADLPDLRIGFAEEAIGALLDRGEVDEAGALLDRIEQPEILASMLVDRHYAPIWPTIEARLGPKGETSVDHFAREKLAVYGDTPGAEGALRDAANAMLLLGHYDDVVDMTANISVENGMSREPVQLLLIRARALAILRRNAEAEKLLASFSRLDPRETPEAVTALITYPEFLDETGQSARALVAAREARVRGAGALNDFGLRWLDRTEICALGELGRTVEANQAMDRLKPLADQNHAATIEALLCVHRDAEASALAVKTLDDKDAGTELLYQFQPGASLWASGPSRLRALWTAFLARPEVRTAFERRGRVLPKAYWPDSAPRAIPRRSFGDLPVT